MYVYVYIYIETNQRSYYWNVAENETAILLLLSLHFFSIIFFFLLLFLLLLFLFLLSLTLLWHSDYYTPTHTLSENEISFLALSQLRFSFLFVSFFCKFFPWYDHSSCYTIKIKLFWWKYGRLPTHSLTNHRILCCFFKTDMWWCKHTIRLYCEETSGEILWNDL